MLSDIAGLALGPLIVVRKFIIGYKISLWFQQIVIYVHFTIKVVFFFQQ